VGVGRAARFMEMRPHCAGLGRRGIGLAREHTYDSTRTPEPRPRVGIGTARIGVTSWATAPSGHWHRAHWRYVPLDGEWPAGLANFRSGRLLFF